MTRYLKVACPHCAGNIEYPSGYGITIDCPHCGGRIRLPGKFPFKVFAISLPVIALAVPGALIVRKLPADVVKIAWQYILVFLTLLFVGGTYFAPTLVAIRRAHRNWVGIFIVNLAFGWTLIGWIVALVWSVHREKKHEEP